MRQGGQPTSTPQPKALPTLSDMLKFQHAFLEGTQRHKLTLAKTKAEEGTASLRYRARKVALSVRVAKELAATLALYTGERPEVLRKLQWHAELKLVGRPPSQYVVFEHVSGDATKRGRGRLGLDQWHKAKVLFLPPVLAQQIRHYLRKARRVCEGDTRTPPKQPRNRTQRSTERERDPWTERHQARPWIVYDLSKRSSGKWVPTPRITPHQTPPHDVITSAAALPGMSSRLW